MPDLLRQCNPRPGLGQVAPRQETPLPDIRRRMFLVPRCRISTSASGLPWVILRIAGTTRITTVPRTARGEGALEAGIRRAAGRYPRGTQGQVGFDPRSFFSFHLSHLRATYLSRIGEYWKGMVSARPLYQGVGRSGWDPETSREGISGGPVWLRVCCRKVVPQGQTESGGVILAAMCWSPSAQWRCDPTGRCAYRLQSLLDCQ